MEVPATQREEKITDGGEGCLLGAQRITSLIGKEQVKAEEVC